MYEAVPNDKGVGEGVLGYLEPLGCSNLVKKIGQEPTLLYRELSQFRLEPLDGLGLYVTVTETPF